MGVRTILLLQPTSQSSYPRQKDPDILVCTEFDSPEVDGEVLVRGVNGAVRTGDFIGVQIEGVDDYDLLGRMVVKGA